MGWLFPGTYGPPTGGLALRCAISCENQPTVTELDSAPACRRPTQRNRRHASIDPRAASVEHLCPDSRASPRSGAQALRVSISILRWLRLRERLMGRHTRLNRSR